MLSVDEALKLVLDRASPLAPRQAPAEDALGLILAEDVASDIDSPPHDKSIVDGYAVVAASIDATHRTLRVLEEVTAGRVPVQTVVPGTATRIMTGAPLSAGADAVVMVEKSELDSVGQYVTLHEAVVRPGQNIMHRAASLKRGQVVLKAGAALGGIEMGLLAEVGRTSVLATPRPDVAIVPTGDELVEPGQQPAAGQIRNSNGPMLKGLVQQAGGRPAMPGIARDSLASLRALLAPALETADVLLLSGGVSAGVLDLVPQVLAEVGVEQVFHKVNLKPGKPLWFGTKQHPGGQTLVFGLPGNPVSTLVCFELFVRPAIAKISGREPQGLARTSARLTHEHQQRGERPTYWPANVRNIEPGILPSFSRELLTPLTSILGFAEVLEQANSLNDLERRMAGHIYTSGSMLREQIENFLFLARRYGESEAQNSCASVTPLAWKGSGDLRTLADANCLVHFPAGDRTFAAGDEVEVALLQ